MIVATLVVFNPATQAVIAPGEAEVEVDWTAAVESQEPAGTLHQVRRVLSTAVLATPAATAVAYRGAAESPYPPTTPAEANIPVGQFLHVAAFAVVDDTQAPFIAKY